MQNRGENDDNLHTNGNSSYRQLKQKTMAFLFATLWNYPEQD